MISDLARFFTEIDKFANQRTMSNLIFFKYDFQNSQKQACLVKKVNWGYIVCIYLIKNIVKDVFYSRVK